MNINDFRKQYPQYDGVDDDKLSKSLHQKYYSNVPYEDFSAKFNPGADPSMFDTVKDALTSREAFQMYGSAAGGLAGGLAGTPTGPGTLTTAATGAGLGAGAGGQLHDLLFGNAGTAGEQASRAAKDIAIEGATALVAPKVMQVGVDAVQKGLTPVAKSIAQNVPMVGKYGKIGARNIDDVRAMEDAGLQYDASLLDDPTLQSVGAAARTKVGSNKILQDVDRANYAAIQDLAEKTATGFGAAETAGDAGKVLKNVAKKNKNKFFNIAEKLYGKVDNYLPDRIGVPELKNFADRRLAMITETATESADNREAIKTLENIISDVGELGIVDPAKIKSFKRLSKSAFEKAPRDRNASDKILIEMRQELGKDIDNAVLDFGGEEGKRALTMANNWWKKGVGDEKSGVVGTLKTFDDIIKKEESADAYAYATTNIFKKKGGAEKLERVLKANPQAANDIRATVFREMGGKDGFSFNTFLSNMNKIAPEAKEVLFGKAGKDFKRLNRISQMAASLEKKRNFSNTENIRVMNEIFTPIKNAMVFGGAGGSAGGLGGALKGAAIGGSVVAGGIGKNIATAKLLTNPKFVKWLADTSERVLIKPDQLPAQIGRLSMMGTGLPKQEGEAIIDYINQLGFNTTKRFDKDDNLKGVEVQ